MGLEASAPSNGRPATDGGEAAPTEGRAASPQPGAELATPATAARDLPKIAEKADDLEAIKKAVDDAAAVGGGLWLSYLFVLFYLAVAAGAVTHEDLFFERSVKLPFLGVDLPLLAFFFLAPILFIVVHAYTLVHLVFLTEKAKRYHQALHDPKREVDGAARENLQWQLPSNIFIQFLAGPPKLRASAFGWLLRAIGWVTLVIAPILLLILMQVQFLPFHSSSITWTQRIALVVDLALIWWLWGRILSGREVDRGFGLSAWLWPPIGFALSPIFRPSRSRTRIFKAHRSAARSSRARHLRAQIFGARTSVAHSFWAHRCRTPVWWRQIWGLHVSGAALGLRVSGIMAWLPSVLPIRRRPGRPSIRTKTIRLNRGTAPRTSSCVEVSSRSPRATCAIKL